MNELHTQPTPLGWDASPQVDIAEPDVDATFTLLALMEADRSCVQQEEGLARTLLGRHKRANRYRPTMTNAQVRPVGLNQAHRCRPK